MAVHLDVPFMVYQANTSGQRHVAHSFDNAARESLAYLKFIAEYYDCLPEATAFIHAHRSSWHVADAVSDLADLKWGAVRRYTPLHRGAFDEYSHWVWSYPGQPQRHLSTPLTASPDGANESRNDAEVVGSSDYPESEEFHYQQARDVAHAWNALFEPAGLGPMPEQIRYFCCAQFVVTRELIQQLPRAFYLRVIDWIHDDSWESHFSASYSRGLVLETVWHIIFGEPAELPAPAQSECEVFACERAAASSSA